MAPCSSESHLQAVSPWEAPGLRASPPLPPPLPWVRKRSPAASPRDPLGWVSPGAGVPTSPPRCLLPSLSPGGLEPGHRIPPPGAWKPLLPPEPFCWASGPSVGSVALALLQTVPAPGWGRSLLPFTLVYRKGRGTAGRRQARAVHQGKGQGGTAPAGTLRPPGLCPHAAQPRPFLAPKPPAPPRGLRAGVGAGVSLCRAAPCEGPPRDPRGAQRGRWCPGLHNSPG